MNHTPVPWYISVTTMVGNKLTAWRISHGANDMRDGPAGDVCVVQSSQADADLIAAAPDLLYALKDLMFEQMGPPNEHRVPQWDAAMERAWAAIDKATGKTK